MSSEWAKRFDPLLDEAVIKERATCRGEMLFDLGRFDEIDARERLERELQKVFIPNRQCIRILRDLVLKARAHARLHYPDAPYFLRHIYAEHEPLADISLPMCLTGLAGTGKSELAKALMRVLPEDAPIFVDENHQGFQSKPAWSITINTMNSFREALATLSGCSAKDPRLLAVCRQQAYRDAVAIIAADEFQFASQSKDASALVTKMLLSLCFVGLPFLYVANFSLLHRLLKRPQEDQDRLLSNVVVLLPDAKPGEEWFAFIAAQQAICPEVFRFSEKGTLLLHGYSAGIKRASTKLLCTAYLIGREKGGSVTERELEAAYHHPLYANYRKNVEAIFLQGIQKKPLKGRQDLWCPVAIPEESAQALNAQAAEHRKQQVAQAKAWSALTQDERKMIKEAEPRKPRQTHKGKSNTKDAHKPLADELKEDTSWMVAQVAQSR